jgi:hypothetical protein
MEVMTTIEGKELPKFLISDTYNNIDDLDNSRGSFVSLTDGMHFSISITHKHFRGRSYLRVLLEANF